jgi:hypothetical protein
VSGQPFPAGAKIIRAGCYGAFCGGDGDFTTKDVVRTILTADPITHENAPRPREAMTLCADCLADFAIGASELPQVFVAIPDPDAGVAVTNVSEFHVYVEAVDGQFHEVKGKLP